MRDAWFARGVISVRDASVSISSTFRRLDRILEQVTILDLEWLHFRKVHRFGSRRGLCSVQLWLPPSPTWMWLQLLTTMLPLGWSRISVRYAILQDWSPANITIRMKKLPNIRLSSIQYGRNPMGCIFQNCHTTQNYHPLASMPK